MKTADYLDECKKLLELSSDYKLAKYWNIDDSSMSQYRKGKLKADAYLCFRIAETLHKSPSMIIAELESENSKNEAKSLYFKRFFSTVGLWIILGLGLQFYNPKLGNAQEITNNGGNRASIDIRAHYTKRKTRKNTNRTWAILADFCRYFTCNWNVKFL
jgi:hypothetical protein